MIFTGLFALFVSNSFLITMMHYNVEAVGKLSGGMVFLPWLRGSFMPQGILVRKWMVLWLVWYVFSLHVGSPIIPLFALSFSIFVFQLYWKQPEDCPLSLSFAFGFWLWSTFFFKQAGNSGNIWSHLIPLVPGFTGAWAGAGLYFGILQKFRYH